MSKFAVKDPEAKAVSVRFTAVELSCSERSVWRMIAAKQLEPVRIGRAVRVTRTSIDRFIQAGGTK